MTGADDGTGPSTRKLFDGSRVTAAALELEVTGGAQAGQSASCVDAPLRIGSAAGNELVLADDSVSRRHAILEPGPTGFVVRDLASTNGTFVNDVRVVGEAILPASGLLTVGTTGVRFAVRSRQVEVPASPRTAFGQLVGRSAAMRRLFSVLERAAPTAASVLVTGPSGTGKEVVARSLHEASPRARGPFVVLDCGAVDPQLISSELFGHEAGAFTGASARRAGVFEQAHGGTLFLDEIGELPLDLQPKLLRVLESRTLKRLGGNATVAVDVRVVSATNRDLPAMVKQGKFREDLFYRLSQLEIHLPPLDARREDIPLLVEVLLERARSSLGPKRLSSQAMARLWLARFPGNVRELRNIVERAAMLAPGPVIEADDLMLPGAPAAASPPPPAAEALALEEALAAHGHVLARTAAALGIAVNTLKARMKRLGISPERRPGKPGPPPGTRRGAAGPR